MSLAVGVAAAVGAGAGYLIATYKKEKTSGTITIGYWKIRGLAAGLRMMCYYKKQPFMDQAYGDDAAEEWFGKNKPALQGKNALMNLPYIVDGESVITQSNSCLLYLGRKLGIDLPAHFDHNHQALDQIMDLRNDTMKIVYPFGSVKTKDEFPGALKTHMEKSVATHFGKLEGFCLGPYVCGAEPQSSDFHLFEMFDQHLTMCKETGIDFDFSKYPALQAQHAAMKAQPALAAYFSSDAYAKYAFNNPKFAHFVGSGFESFGPTQNTLSSKS
jgi:glutathione S-transferase